MLVYLSQYYLAQNTYASQLNCGIQLIMVSVPRTQLTWLKVRRDECYSNMYVIAKIRCWFFSPFHCSFINLYVFQFLFFSKFSLGQYFNPYDYISGVVWCDMKTWKKNTNFDDPRNWNTGGVKCSNDIKKFPKDMRASVFIQKNESLQELVSYQLLWIVYIRANGRVFIPLWSISNSVKGMPNYLEYELRYLHVLLVQMTTKFKVSNRESQHSWLL